jgi:hypothetical protein
MAGMDCEANVAIAIGITHVTNSETMSIFEVENGKIDEKI